MESNKPRLCEKGHVTVVSVAFPPAPGGSSVLTANLLKYFDPRSLSVLRAKWPNEKIALADLDMKQDIIYTRQAHSWKLNKLKESFERKKVINRIVNKVRENQSVAIMAIYPDLFMLDCALAASEELNLPFVPYIHDTVVETQDGAKAKAKAEDIQKRYFANSAAIFVMSDGIKNLFRRKYGVESVSLIHTYPEEIVANLEEDRDGIMFTGDIYNINASSMKRVADACKALGHKLKVATNKDENYHINLGLDPASIELVYYPNRAEYIQALQKTKVLILGLSWPDETNVHFDEMSTIFPTKTCEYLASGSQIMVHCPEEYFLAEYVNKHHCARYVGDRDQEAIESTLQSMLNQEDDTVFVKNASKAATQFSVSEVAPAFKTIFDQAVN